MAITTEPFPAMPELPEVETTRRGLAPHVEGRRIQAVTLRRPDLRWPIPPEVARDLPGQRIQAVRRRAKYLLMDTEAGSALLHLGMSGSLRVLPATTPVTAHDHVDIALAGERGHAGRVLRFNDPRRFGSLLWQAPGQTHPLLQGLGPEPLSDAFDGDYLFAMSRGRKAPVKTFLMAPHRPRRAGRCRHGRSSARSPADRRWRGRPPGRRAETGPRNHGARTAP